MGIRPVLVAMLAVGLALGATGCGMESSWSASPAFLGEDAAPGFVVAEAGAGETMEVGDEGEVVDVLGYLTFTSEDIEENMEGDTTYTTTEVAITERTVCTLEGTSVEPAEFVYEMLSAQEVGGEYNISLNYTSSDDEATEVSVESP